MAKPIKKPQALMLGDTVALIRPSSRLDLNRWRELQCALQNLGYCVATYSGKFSQDPFFAASDRERAAELMWALKEPGVRAIFVARGGYGAIRLPEFCRLPKAAEPKIVVGYSDTTYLHQWVQNELQWVTFHGPLMGFLETKSLRKFSDRLLKLPTDAWKEKWSEVRVLRSGDTKRARLVGGNLSVFELSGPAALPKEPVVLALEDVNENFYRIDRMLRILKDAKYDRYIRGIICGTFHRCGQVDAKTFGWKRIESTLLELTDGPVWTNAQFGHGLQDQRILPLGSWVRMKGKILEGLEGVVRCR